MAAPHSSSSRLTRVARVLVGAEILLAVGGLGGAVGLLAGFVDFAESTGDLPWQSPVVAGIALGALNGLLPLLVAVAALRRAPWAPLGHVLVGIVLMGWIVVQVAFIGLNSWLQPVYFGYGAVVTALAVWNIARMERRRRITLLQRWVVNPPMKAAVWLGWAPGHVLVETWGRRSGRRRRTVVGMYFDGDTGWVIAEQGRRAGYVRNLEAYPQVRVRIDGRWRHAVAAVIPDDDPEARLDGFARPRHAAWVRRLGTDLLTIRFDLVPPVLSEPPIEEAPMVEPLELMRVR